MGAMEGMRLLLALVSCALLRFSYVQAQPPVLSPAVQVSVGQTATLSCDVGVKEQHAVWFLKQIPGEAPQLLLYHHDSYSAPVHGPGMSSAHFTATINSAGTVYQLTVKDSQPADTAHYYCAKWYNSLSGLVFSQSGKLIVTGVNLPEPSVVVFPPQPAVASGNIQPTLTCHISNLTVPLGTVSWTVNGKAEGNAVTSEPARDSPGNTYSISSYLTMPAVNPDSSVTCQIQQAGSSTITSGSMKLSECA